MTDILPALLFVYDHTEKRPVYINRAVTAILGYSDDEIRQMSSTEFHELIHPEDAARVAEHFLKLSSAADREVLQIVYRMRHKDGSSRSFHVSETAFARNAAGQVFQTIATATDVTENQKAHKELQFLSSRFIESPRGGAKKTRV